jgi:hypothetical protein
VEAVPWAPGVALAVCGVLEMTSSPFKCAEEPFKSVDESLEFEEVGSLAHLVDPVAVPAWEQAGCICQIVPTRTSQTKGSAYRSHWLLWGLRGVCEDAHLPSWLQNGIEVNNLQSLKGPAQAGA